MYLDVFIGAVDVPGFSWGESPADNDYSAVVPRFISHAIPDSYEAFFELKDRINKGHYTSKAIDWGTWAARVSKAQIVEFMQSMYGKDVMEENSEHTDSARMTELIVLVKNLDDRQTYALVARES